MSLLVVNFFERGRGAAVITAGSSIASIAVNLTCAVLELHRFWGGGGHAVDTKVASRQCTFQTIFIHR